MINKLAFGFIASFLIALFLGPFVIKKLKELKYGQRILEDGPTWHMSKQNTPTMGGWIFIVAVLVTVVLGAFREGEGLLATTDIPIAILALVYGLIGCIDDMTKIKKKQNAGLTPMQKILLQVAAATLFITVMRLMGVVTPELFIPFAKIYVTLPWAAYLFFSIFVIVGTVNAVNLTDGIDGLATSVTLVVTAFFAVFYASIQGVMPITFAVALMGALLAFYMFNKNPARVFMGDTGSLFLGGAVAGMAFAINAPLLLLPVGIIYVAEAMSDILQVGYFKLTHGKRIFKMAPLHHHFEKCGWSEKKIVIVFTLVTAIACCITLII